MDPNASIGWVSLTVSDLEEALSFYTGILGMDKISNTENGCVVLGVARTPLIILREQRGATPKPPNTRGLYHYAILLPNRRNLADMFTRLYNMWKLDGGADHLVSEALYLRDPDGHGVEIYTDKPRGMWRRSRSGEISMATLPLNLDNLLKELQREETGKNLNSRWRLPTGTRIGHIHLHVSNLKKAEEFYHKILGFDITTRSYPGALFMSAGGYHHHIGVNVWAGEDAPPTPSESVQLVSFAIKLTDRDNLNKITKRLEEKRIKFNEGLINKITGYRGVSVKDFDGNNVELISWKMIKIYSESLWICLEKLGLWLSLR